MIRAVALCLALLSSACELVPHSTPPVAAPTVVPAFVYTPPTDEERAAERARMAGLRRVVRRAAYRRALAIRRADFRRAYALSLLLN